MPPEMTLENLCELSVAALLNPDDLVIRRLQTVGFIAYELQRALDEIPDFYTTNRGERRIDLYENQHYKRAQELMTVTGLKEEGMDDLLLRQGHGYAYGLGAQVMKDFKQLYPSSVKSDS